MACLLGGASAIPYPCQAMPRSSVGVAVLPPPPPPPRAGSCCAQGWDSNFCAKHVPNILQELSYSDGGATCAAFPQLVEGVQEVLVSLAKLRHEHDENLFTSVLAALGKVQPTASGSSGDKPNQNDSSIVIDTMLKKRKRKECELGPARAERRRQRADNFRRSMREQEAAWVERLATDDPNLWFDPEI